MIKNNLFSNNIMKFFSKHHSNKKKNNEKIENNEKNILVLRLNSQKRNINTSSFDTINNSEKNIVTLSEILSTNIKKHLICDDAFSNRLVLKKYLNIFGCDVDEAENGLEAVNKIENGNIYNVIWMDIKMPRLDGFDATMRITKTLNYKNIIIGLTGYVDEITTKKCYDAGMKHVVSKPFDKKVIQMYCDKY